MGKEKKAWSARFNECCDAHGIPRKGENRQAIVGKLFGVSQVGARKWLEGESMPTLEKCIEMAQLFKVRFEWFMTGRGRREHLGLLDANKLTPGESRLVLDYREVDDDVKRAISTMATQLAKQKHSAAKEGR